MTNETLNSIMGFVKANFFKIMGVFLVIGLIQYACSDKEPAANVSLLKARPSTTEAPIG